MFSFRKIDPQDNASLGRLLRQYGQGYSDHCFGGLYIWQDLFRTEAAVSGETVLIRGEYGGKRFYQAPIGPDFSGAVRWLVENDSENLFFLSISELARNRLESEFPGRFSFSYDRDNSDYIYDRRELESFAGKKFQQKRNHVNRFIRQYGQPNVVLLDRENISMIYGAEHCWLHENDASDEGLRMERRAIGRCIDRFEELGFFGAALLLEDKVAAFGIGERLSDNTVIEHFEKASREIDGCYTVMTREFARMLPADVCFINREEDMGLEGLRKAKLSLNPCRLEEKYDAVFLG